MTVYACHLKYTWFYFLFRRAHTRRIYLKDTVIFAVCSSGKKGGIPAWHIMNAIGSARVFDTILAFEFTIKLLTTTIALSEGTRKTIGKKQIRR